MNGTRLTRRAAMRTALAGAAAAAAATWQTPRIEGLSVAPDVAQAATCVGGTVSSGVENATQAGAISGRLCWGTGSNGSCSPRDLPSLVVDRFTVALNVDGFTEGNTFGDATNNGILTATLNGIDPPFQSCNVSMGPEGAGSDCGDGGGTVWFSTEVLTFVDNGTQSLGGWGCNGGDLTLNSGSFTVVVTCTCV